MEKLFIIASREGYRFVTPRGLATTEDLWTLPLKNNNGSSLNDVAKHINKQVKASEEDEFVDEVSAEDETEANKLEIVKYIIKVKLEEKAAKTKSADNKRHKDKLLGILAEKRDAALISKSEAEILKELEALG